MVTPDVPAAVMPKGVDTFRKRLKQVCADHNRAAVARLVVTWAHTLPPKG